MNLKNELYANKSLVSAYGELKFDAEGILVEPELEETQLEDLAKLKGFELVEKAEKHDKKVLEESKGENKEEPEKPAEAEPEKPAEEESEKPTKQRRSKSKKSGE